MDFFFEKRYIKGGENLVADYLSRPPAQHSADIVAEIFPDYLMRAKESGIAPIKEGEKNSLWLQLRDPQIRLYYKALTQEPITK